MNLPVLEKTCDAATIMAFAILSDDYNPIHIDREFAAGTEMGGIIAHGPMAMAIVWEMLERAFPADRLRGMTLDVRFRQPMRENDVIRTGGKLQDDSVTYAIWVRNQRDQDVMIGTIVPATV